MQIRGEAHQQPAVSCLEIVVAVCRIAATLQKARKRSTKLRASRAAQGTRAPRFQNECRSRAATRASGASRGAIAEPASGTWAPPLSTSKPPSPARRLARAARRDRAPLPAARRLARPPPASTARGARESTRAAHSAAASASWDASAPSPSPSSSPFASLRATWRPRRRRCCSSLASQGGRAWCSQCGLVRESRAIRQRAPAG